MKFPLMLLMKSPLPRRAAAAITVCLAAGLTAGARAETRNVILIIGDGMDDHQITIARNYLHGAKGMLTLDTLAHRSAVQVITVREDDPSQHVYVADSANSGTAMATGAVTSRGRISTRPGTDQDIPTIAELATAAGYRAGVVTTSSVTDATPAVFATHINHRLCENPAAMVTGARDCSAHLKANGGRGSIAEQLVESRLDVILGGGRTHFSKTAEPMPGGTSSGTVLDLAQRKGFHLVSNAAELAQAPEGARLLGLFAKKHLAVRMQGEMGRVAEDVQRSFLNRLHSSLGSVTLPEPMRCEPNPAARNTPSLASLARAAVRHLESGRKGTRKDSRKEKGFFLMVESASIDKQSHVRNPCGAIGELEQLDEVVAFALDYARLRPGTLVLVTADHSHAAQLVPERTLYHWVGLPIYTPGKLARLTTREGSIMGVNYATNRSFSEEHTGAAVPLYANKALRGRLPAHVLQTDLFWLMHRHLEL